MLEHRKPVEVFLPEALLTRWFERIYDMTRFRIRARVWSTMPVTTW
jgi:hypothetical protein